MSIPEWNVDPDSKSQISFENPQVSVLVTETSYALKIEELAGTKELSINFPHPFLSKINGVLRPIFDLQHDQSQN